VVTADLSTADVPGMLLAGMWFDVNSAPGLLASGVPEEAVQRLRYDRGRGCLASPEAMAQLREWRAGHVVPGGSCHDCGHPIGQHDHDGCTNGCIRPTVDALAGCLCGNEAPRG
jgi:hypothetical protein